MEEGRGDERENLAVVNLEDDLKVFLIDKGTLGLVLTF